MHSRLPSSSVCRGCPTAAAPHLCALPCPVALRSAPVQVGGYNSRGFVEVLAASQTTTTKEWFQVRCFGGGG